MQIDNSIEIWVELRLFTCVSRQYSDAQGGGPILGPGFDGCEVAGMSRREVRYVRA